MAHPKATELQRDPLPISSSLVSAQRRLTASRSVTALPQLYLGPAAIADYVGSIHIGTSNPAGTFALTGNEDKAMFPSDVLLILAVAAIIAAVVLGTVGGLRLRAAWRRGEGR